ncbi:MAG: histidine triad nucleotide-binding protein [Elusimicrobiaceae bacterium]|nr:histidine triad nucleotide-binding protein [Elusimicrobiaceae bacterium]
MPDCIFCKIAAGQVQSRMVYETEDIVAFADLNPQAPTHILIIPVKHIAKLTAAEPAELELLGKLQLAAAAIAKQFGIKDFRLVTNNGRGAGQSVDHLHYHLLAGRRMNWPPG